MGLLDRLARRFGQEPRQDSWPTEQPAATEAHALDRYERMLGSAPPAVVERVHTEAFGRLSTQQRDAIFLRLTLMAGMDERPTDSSSAALSRTAVRVETRQRGEIVRMLGSDAPGASLSSALGAAILGTVAAYAVSSAVWEAWASNGDEENTYGGGDGIGDFHF